MKSSAVKRPQLASSPFRREPEPVIEEFAVDDRVTHDAYGLGRVVSSDPRWLTVDFGTRTVRVDTPFHRLQKL
jgi:hypothetical protein